MPTITINLEQFFDLLGKKMTITEFEDLCFDYGLEYEEDGDSTETVKVELPANRYDLLSVEGLALAFRSYLQNYQIKHTLIDSTTIDKGTQTIIKNNQKPTPRPCSQ